MMDVVISYTSNTKVKSDPKIELKSKESIEGTKENNSCSTTWADSTIVFQPNPNPQNSPFGPLKVKSQPKKLSKNQKLGLKKT